MWETEAGWAPAHRKGEEAGQAQDRDAPGAQAAVWGGCRSAGLLCVKPRSRSQHHQTKQTVRGSRHHLTESPKGGNVGGSQSSWGERPIFLRESLSGDSRPRKITRSGLLFCLCQGHPVCCKLFFRRLSFWSFPCLSRIIFKFLTKCVGARECWRQWRLEASDPLELEL